MTHRLVVTALFVASGLTVSDREGTVFDPGSRRAPGPELVRAVTTTDNFQIPIELLVFIPCAAGGAGELISVSGDLHVLTHLTVNHNHFTFKQHFQPQGISGTGLTTGDKYQATGVTQQTQTGSLQNQQFEFTFVNNFRMIGQRAGNNLLVHTNLHVTINAKGVVTVNHENSSVECH